MIYESVNNDVAIRQGDIFFGIPRVDMSLAELPIVEEDGASRLRAWSEIISENGTAPPVAAVLSLTPVNAIVISQNCDAARGEYLSLCEFNPFLTSIGQKDAPKSPKKWGDLITRHTKTNHRLFYLPADLDHNLPEPMAVDFRVPIRVRRADIESLRGALRRTRLNDVASEHFRESLAHYFRRYAYNEWYPFTKEQFAAYAEACPEGVTPYRWQQ